jgi:hypothetical protein
VCWRAETSYVLLAQGENPHSELLPHLMGKKGPSGFGSATTAEAVAASWDGTGKVGGWRLPRISWLARMQGLKQQTAVLTEVCLFLLCRWQSSLGATLGSAGSRRVCWQQGAQVRRCCRAPCWRWFRKFPWE